jgi:CRISPR-associated protein Cas2
MKGYGEHWQYSVFFCILKHIDLVRMRADLSEVIHHTEDQVIVVDLGPGGAEVQEAIVVLGVPLPPTENGFVVV